MSPIRRLSLTAVVVFALDQLLKAWVLYGLDLLNRGSLEVLPPLLQFHMAWNRGVNFGLFAGADMRWALIGIAVAISVGVFVWVLRDGSGRLAQISAGLLIGGALGNAFDRVVYGAVADFLNVSCCGIENPYAFNVADIAVFLGAVGLVLFTGESDKTA